MSAIDTLKQVIGSGIPVPSHLIINNATVNADTGQVYASVGWSFGDPSADGKPAPQVGVYGKFVPPSSKIGGGLVDLLNGIREQTAADDDSPGVLTLGELGSILLGDLGDLIGGK